MVANQARQRYFDPSENTERKFVGLGQRVRTRFESLGHGLTHIVRMTQTEVLTLE